MQPERADADQTGALELASELHIVAGTLIRRLREQAGMSDLTPAQKSVLLRLERDGPMTGSALARASAMRPQSMGAIVAGLEAAGHVVGAPDPADRRQTIISITDHFRKTVSAGRAARQDWLFRALQSKLTAPEREQLAGALKLLDRLLRP